MILTIPLAQLDELLSGQVVFACLVILVLALGGFVAVRYLRKWTRSSDQTPAGGFTLADLRRLRQEGKMSEEEFKQTSALVASAHKAHLMKPVEKPEPPAGRSAKQGPTKPK